MTISKEKKKLAGKVCVGLAIMGFLIYCTYIGINKYKAHFQNVSAGPIITGPGPSPSPSNTNPVTSGPSPSNTNPVTSGPSPSPSNTNPVTTSTPAITKPEVEFSDLLKFLGQPNKPPGFYYEEDPDILVSNGLYSMYISSNL